MPANDIIYLLQSFEQKLGELSIDDQQIAKEVINARQDIQNLLSNPDSVPEPDEYFMQQLSEVARHFEEDHPVLTEWVSKLSDLFSRIGI